MLLPLSELPLFEGLPFRSLRFYVDGAGEDEAGGLPSNWGFLYGLQINDILKTGRTDLRIEYADNYVAGKPNVFYNHSIYRSGYTHDGRVIGHHMGTQSSDLFVQLSHYLTDDVLVNLAFNRQTSHFRTRAQASVNIYELDVTFFASGDWRIQAGTAMRTGAISEATIITSSEVGLDHGGSDESMIDPDRRLMSDLSCSGSATPGLAAT
jgi:hypothetical protein